MYDEENPIPIAKIVQSNTHTTYNVIYAECVVPEESYETNNIDVTAEIVTIPNRCRQINPSSNLFFRGYSRESRYWYYISIKGACLLCMYMSIMYFMISTVFYTN